MPEKLTNSQSKHWHPNMALVTHVVFSQVLFFRTSLQQMVVFDANMTNEWEHQSIHCDDNVPCAIICDMELSCLNSTVVCPNNHQCNIVCSAEKSCQQINISPPQNQTLFNLSFTGKASLWGVTYPMYVDNHQDLTLICNNSGQCQGMDIICPSAAKCTIQCITNGACTKV